MKIRTTGHIAAFFLAGLMLVQAVFVLIPEQNEVLCLAEDHIAIEIPESRQPVEHGEASAGLIPLHDFHHPEDASCVDIPLQTQTLVPGAAVSNILPSHLLFFVEKPASRFSDAERVSFLIKYPPGLFTVPSGRHADGSRVLLI